MINQSSMNLLHEIAEELEEFLEISYNEAFKLAIEFWKAESLHAIKESLSNNGALVNKIDIISDALYYKK